jgi:exosortase A-associated hydrolase 2
VPAEALFIDVQPGALGRRFAMHHVPQSGPVLGLAVYVHPFAEEMNKSRRMAALHSAALTAESWAVLQLDLLGCGDSDGDFGQASWDAWVDDVVQACQWLRRRHGLVQAPLCLWGLRSGCLLAAQAAHRLDGIVTFLFWQPVVNGQVHLQQFLRLKLAGDLIGGTGKQAMDSARQALADGQSVEIAGYNLAPGLAQGLAGARLEPPPIVGPVDWFDLTSREDLAPGPAADSAAASWQAAGHRVRRHKLVGPSFWQTTEIEVCRDLIDRSVAVLGLSTTRRAVRPLPA